MRLTLYHYWRSSSSWRVRWALAHKAVAHELVAVNLLEGEQRSAEHLSRNPTGFVPSLFIDPPGIHLAESSAIIEWLEETYPSQPLFPAAPLDRARVRQLCQIINAGTQPLQNLSVQRKHSSDPSQQKQWTQHWISVGLNAYEEVCRKTAGRYSFGDRLTAADLFLIPQCYNASRFDVPISQYPNIRRVHENALELESYHDSAPDRFAPAQVAPGSQ